MMSKDYSSLRLKCPYCGVHLSSHRDLRVHVGGSHKDKVDAFMEEYFGGRWIEVDFISLMLRKSLGRVTEESCRECSGCDVDCPVSSVQEGFSPHHIPVQVSRGGIKDLLRSEAIWACTNCFACGEGCKAGMPPYDVIETLQNLSARIGYHFPDECRSYEKSVLKTGFIQRPGVLKSVELTRLTSEGLELPQVPSPPDLPRFKEALRKLSDMRVPL